MIQVAPAPEIGEKAYYLVRFLPKIAWKLKKFDGGGVVRIPRAPLDPPMISDTYYAFPNTYYRVQYH